MSAVDAVITSAVGTIAFGHAPFLLHALSFSAPVLTAAEAGESGKVGMRTAEIVGYILPEGADRAARAAAMETARRLVCRIAGCADGFCLTQGGRSIRLYCRCAPEFSTEVPLNDADAARFTLRGESAEEDGAFLGDTVWYTGRALGGALVFPLAIPEAVSFGAIAGDGTLTVENPGDVAAGFRLTVTAKGDGIETFRIVLGEDGIAVAHALSDGESFTIDTRPGFRDVTADGVSILEAVDWRSVFFALPPGENVLFWEATGGGQAQLSLSLAPRYL